MFAQYLGLFLSFVVWAALPSAWAAPELPAITLQPGFQISSFAEQVVGARSMTISPAGTVFVGSRGAGKVYALRDRDGDGKAEERYLIANNLDLPNGVAFYDGALYVAEISRILRFDQIEQHLSAPPQPVVVYDQLPRETHHGWRYLRVGPDGYLYIGIGAPCNICLRPEPIFASIVRLQRSGEGLEVFAAGVRNSVGFDWHPETKELWFTENGRDMLGDDSPPDELNHAPVKGLHFGYPYCHAGSLRDPSFGKKRPCSDFKGPVQKLGPHVAALGMRFYTGAMFPERYRKQIFIAEHGSWNRSAPIGYRISLVSLQGNRATSYETFASGWLDEKAQVHGRPVDILQAPDGALLVSDDAGDRIYRISYRSEGG